jgi:hypothetical protein
MNHSSLLCDSALTQREREKSLFVRFSLSLFETFLLLFVVIVLDPSYCLPEERDRAESLDSIMLRPMSEHKTSGNTTL